MPIDANRRPAAHGMNRIPGLYQCEYDRQLELVSKPDLRLWPVENGWPTDTVEYQKMVDASSCAQAAQEPRGSDGARRNYRNVGPELAQSVCRRYPLACRAV